jgi:hypothetical protein
VTSQKTPFSITNLLGKLACLVHCGLFQHRELFKISKSYMLNDVHKWHKNLHSVSFEFVCLIWTDANMKAELTAALLYSYWHTLTIFCTSTHQRFCWHNRLSCLDRNQHEGARSGDLTDHSTGPSIPATCLEMSRSGVDAEQSQREVEVHSAATTVSSGVSRGARGYYILEEES